MTLRPLDKDARVEAWAGILSSDCDEDDVEAAAGVFAQYLASERACICMKVVSLTSYETRETRTYTVVILRDHPEIAAEVRTVLETKHGASHEAV